MAEVLLFHHGHGLTPGVLAWAERLRAAGHRVHTPDLYDGRVFDDLEEGLSHARDTGFGEVVERGRRAADGVPDDLVVIGLSLGAMPAQLLAQTRPGTRAAVLLHACVPVGEFGESWPADLPVQVHGMADDPFFAGEGDLDAARELVDAAADGELFLYPGDEHLFTDSSLPAYDAAATALLTERVLGLLARA